jgi:adenine-specific DNA-methyltransferase
VIKYLGSKRRLVPALVAAAEATGARTAIDLFTGTTRVAQAWKALGIETWAVDTARYSHTLARAAIATDATAVDLDALDRELARLDALPGRAGYFTETFCVASRYLQPHNGERVDAVRDAIAADHAGTPLEPLLLASLMLAADRVDSTTGVQMAYLKQWAPRSHQRLTMRRPPLLAGPGHAWRADALDAVHDLPAVDLAYLDPPYNQHRYYTNYHVWETLVAWDRPEHYGIACKRLDCRDPSTRSPFNTKATIAPALGYLIEHVPARTAMLSFSNEGFLPLESLIAMCHNRFPSVEAVGFGSRRYVGAQIGIHNPAGEKVGRVSHLHNREYLVVAGDPQVVGRTSEALCSAGGDLLTLARGVPVGEIGEVGIVREHLDDGLVEVERPLEAEHR